VSRKNLAIPTRWINFLVSAWVKIFSEGQRKKRPFRRLWCINHHLLRSVGKFSDEKFAFFPSSRNLSRLLHFPLARNFIQVWAALFINHVIVEQNSKIECYSHPPPIRKWLQASELVLSIKQIFSYKERRYRLPHSSRARTCCYVHWHLPHKFCAASKQACFIRLPHSSSACAYSFLLCIFLFSSFAQPQSKCLLLFLLILLNIHR
jgi:hypothetical protein